MEIFHHESCNATLPPPPDMPEPDCESLPVVEYTDRWGEWSASFWKPSPGELAVLVAGGAVVLNVRARGEAHPVVSVSVTGPHISQVPPAVVGNTILKSRRWLEGGKLDAVPEELRDTVAWLKQRVYDRCHSNNKVSVLTEAPDEHCIFAATQFVSEEEAVQWLASQLGLALDE